MARRGQAAATGNAPEASAPYNNSSLYGRPAPWHDTGDKAIDPHNFLLGRERPTDDEKDLLGRQPGDAEQLFPRFTTASVTTTGQVTVNGKTLNLWTFSQLETLSQRVLRERANAIRDAVGEDACPPMPSGQPQDLVRWIILMQSELTQERPTVGRGGALGRADAVPPSFCRESEERPIRGESMSPQKPRPPFGPKMGQQHGATRDNFAQLIRGGETGPHEVYGIVSNRKNGEGKRHLIPESNMVSVGVSRAAEPPIDGRRHFDCDDHLMEQVRELEAWQKDPRAAALAGASNAYAGAPRVTSGPVAHVSESSLYHAGSVAQEREAPVGGDRRRHAAVPGRMVTPGVSDPGPEETRLGGRRHLDGFGGSKFSQADEGQQYNSNWKKNPSGLRGVSMIC